MDKQAMLEGVYQEAFNDEVQKIAAEKELGAYGAAGRRLLATVPRTFLGGAAGSAAGAGIGAGVGAGLAKLLRKAGKPGAVAGALAGGYAGLAGGQLAGSAKGEKAFIKKHTGREVSAARALGRGALTTVPRAYGYGLGGGAVGAGLGALAGLAARRPGLGAAIGAGLGGYGGVIHGYAKGSKALLARTRRLAKKD